MRSLLNEVSGALKSSMGLELAANDFGRVPDPSLGHIAIPCFKWAKGSGKKPIEIAVSVAETLKSTKLEWLSDAQALGPYVNLFLNPAKAFAHLQENAKTFGSSSLGNGKTVCIDYSSPNVAKEIGLHHIRSTAIGHSLSKIAEHHGYKTVRINYLGDWGTSFGKLIVALELYGQESELDGGGLPYMLDLYVRFNKAEKDDPSLADRARQAFSDLEAGNQSHRRLWKLFRDISIRELKKSYDRLGIVYDHFDGESLYEGKLDSVVTEISNSLGTRVSDGALVCDLPGHKIPILLKKADGASLYITRDVAAAEDRYQRFAFHQSWYVVAVQQKLHFQQLFDLLSALKKPYAGQLKHIWFGMMSFGTKTMKTREGNVLLLSDVLNEAHSRALEVIKAKNPDLQNASEVAEMIGMGAILFNDLSQNRTHDVKFVWEQALSFEGDTAPFVQYTHARCHSLVAKAQKHLSSLKASSLNDEASVLTHEAVQNLLKEIYFFELASEKALAELDPSQIASSILDISKAMNQLYHKIRFMDETSKNRLSDLVSLTQATATVLNLGLGLLGIRAPKEM
jgi:arginyl-tRNA synthetase